MIKKIDKRKFNGGKRANAGRKKRNFPPKVGTTIYLKVSSKEDEKNAKKAIYDFLDNVYYPNLIKNN